MRVPVSWLAEHVDLPAGVAPAGIAAALIRAGLEVERVDEVGGDVSGVVVGEVLDYADEPQKNGKTIRWCHVDVGGDEPRGIVCGAHNFAVGDRVPVALPGAVLAGDFRITARKTYGHVSDGMICSGRELGVSDEHEGILVLPGKPDVGADAVELLGLRDAVLDIAVSPDRSYCLSVRGVAREVATAYGVAFRDPAGADSVTGPGHPVAIDDGVGCDRFVALSVTGVDPSRPTPTWMQRRLLLAGMRPVSLVVDVTNYVMLLTGQPLHAFDASRLRGGIVVRRAAAGERLVTLDDADRALDPDDIVVADDSGPISLAGVMGGASTEVGPGTTEVLLEAAHWDPPSIARAARRHKLPSEAARRFERGVDPELPPHATALAFSLLAEHGGGAQARGLTDVDLRPGPVTVQLPVALAGRLAGVPYDKGTVARRLVDVGCAVAGDDPLTVTPPSWRPDLRLPADLVEEVVRLEGYDAIPSLLPRAVPGGGLTRPQRLRRQVGRALAAAGFVEAQTSPFVAESTLDALLVPADDDRRRLVRLANPLSDGEPYLRTTLLPGLLATLLRNVGRGMTDVALYEVGSVFLRTAEVTPAEAAAVWPGVEGRPDDATLARLDALLPSQPRHAAVVMCGLAEPAGWWGPGRPASWADAVESARALAASLGIALETAAAAIPPFHPGRCAALRAGGRLIGSAGQLHPRVVAALDLPPGTVAMELDLDALLELDPGPPAAPVVPPYPPAVRDVAVVVPDGVPAADVAAALRLGAGPLLESLRLFDVYAGSPVPAGHRSLAYALRFRAPDRTLTDEEANAARDAAVAAAAQRVGAALRG